MDKIKKTRKKSSPSAKKEARPPIPENIKVALLRETNYRCGYCMMNITPAAYYTENRKSTEAKEVVPMYYQPYDCAHIEPYNEEDPATNSFYNLIALCKNCHWKTEPQHSNAIITKEQLKALKLHWMIASGRFTRLEIDCLFALYNAKSPIECDLSVAYVSNDDGETEPAIFYPMYASYLFKNILYRYVVSGKFRGVKDDNTGIMSQTILNNTIYALRYIKINPCGIDFCKNFHEAYQELDKIEI